VPRNSVRVRLRYRRRRDLEAPAAKSPPRISGNRCGGHFRKRESPVDSGHLHGGHGPVASETVRANLLQMSLVRVGRLWLKNEAPPQRAYSMLSPSHRRRLDIRDMAIE